MIQNKKKWHIFNKKKMAYTSKYVVSYSFYLVQSTGMETILNFQCIVLNFNETIKKHITSLQQYIFLTNMNDESVISL